MNLNNLHIVKCECVCAYVSTEFLIQATQETMCSEANCGTHILLFGEVKLSAAVLEHGHMVRPFTQGHLKDKMDDKGRGMQK